MQIGTEDMAQWIRGFVYIFSAHRKLSVAVCVSVTAALWFLRFAAHERAQFQGWPESLSLGYSGKWQSRTLDTCAQWMPAPRTHTPSFVHRNVQMNVSQRAVQWEGLCSECLCIDCTFSVMAFS